MAHRSLIGTLPGFVASQNWFPQKSDIFWTAVDWACPDGLLNALLPTLYFGRALVGTLGPFSSMRAFEIMERLNDQHGLAIPVEATAMAKEETYRRLIPFVRPIPAVVAEARRLAAVCPVAVASGGIREVVEETLRTLGLRDLFPVLSTADDVLRGKPAPDVFLVAAKRLGVAPEGCVVYEDAPAGLEAARRAGMRAVNILLHI